MKAKYFPLVLLLGSHAWSGEVQWGDSTSLKPQEDNSYGTKAFSTKDISPDEFSKGFHGSLFDKSFTTQSNSSFDKEFSLAGKDYKTTDLDFDKIYGTKDLDFKSKVSSLNDQSSSLQLNDHPWSSKPAAYGFDKQIPLKEFKGPEAEAVAQDMSSIYRKLNTAKHVPDRDYTVDEVRRLVNNGDIPDVKASGGSEGKKMDPTSLPPSSLPAP